MDTIKKILSTKQTGECVISGWVRSIRKKEKFSFLMVNDGSCQENFQVILDLGIPGYEDVSNALTGASVVIKGNVVESQGRGQSLEMVDCPVNSSEIVTKRTLFRRNQPRLNLLEKTLI